MMLLDCKMRYINNEIEKWIPKKKNRIFIEEQVLGKYILLTMRRNELTIPLKKLICIKSYTGWLPLREENIQVKSVYENEDLLLLWH